MEEAFKALGDATRARIVRMLAENGELCVCVLMEHLGMGQSAVSHHMAALRHAGLVSFRKEGQWVYYSLNIDAFEAGPLAFLHEIMQAARASADKRAISTCCKAEQCKGIK
ncbi:MAG: metalloregulator ArsR/SmtB family transcription factor [Armatimonadota bacterium]|nr:metalloregulator ArsR/SmtB family transcription factor [bacterium]